MEGQARQDAGSGVGDHECHAVNVEGARRDADRHRHEYDAAVFFKPRKSAGTGL